MKKIITTVLCLLLLVGTPLITLAKSENSGSGGGSDDNNSSQQQSGGDDDEDDNETENEVENETENEVEHGIEVSSASSNKGKSAEHKLSKLSDDTEDPEVEQETQDLADEQGDINLLSDQAVSKISTRPAFVKFLIGPDYKNLGQLRSELVHLQNNIRRLEKLQETADSADQEAIAEALDELTGMETQLQTTISEDLSGFSLFGWLFRWLNGFVPPEPEASPTPSGSASPTPIESATPEPTATESASPIPTSTP